MTARTPIAYLFVSGLCLLLHTADLIVADKLHVPLGMAVLGSFMIVAGVGYALHTAVTFGQPFAARGFFRYIIAMSANIPLAYISVWIWHVAIALPMLFASPLASACMLGLNFLLGRWAITAPKKTLAKIR